MDDELHAITDREKYITDLHSQLQKVIAGQSFEYTDAGKLIVEILSADVNNFTKQILSNKFINDHQGYVDARAKANYAASLLGRLKTLDDPKKEKEIRESLEAAKNDEPTVEPTNG
jgi:hypothetical protein